MFVKHHADLIGYRLANLICYNSIFGKDGPGDPLPDRPRDPDQVVEGAEEGRHLQQRRPGNKAGPFQNQTLQQALSFRDAKWIYMLLINKTWHSYFMTRKARSYLSLKIT